MTRIMVQQSIVCIPTRLSETCHGITTMQNKIILNKFKQTETYRRLSKTTLFLQKLHQQPLRSRFHPQERRPQNSNMRIKINQAYSCWRIEREIHE